MSLDFLKSPVFMRVCAGCANGNEATSALDPETEETLKQKLEGIPKEKTVIAVTHRLNITENFDLIYMVKDGRVTGYGD